MSPSITVTVTATDGSAPREAGASMRVFADRIQGTIGGGALEWQAMGHARAMLADGRTTDQRTIVLGPDAGQCCGGVVRLSFVAGGPGAEPTQPPLFIWGAGHVGRAIAAQIAPFDDCAVTLVDVAADRLPDPVPHDVSPLVAADPTQAIAHLPKDALHLIVTYSHDLDLALCDALLRHGFMACGLIGSATKWARFRARLRKMGHSDAEISRIACPIGNPTLGKHPHAIAIGVAAGLVSAMNHRRLEGCFGHRPAHD